MLNIALIGTGAISDYHIDAYLAFPERCKITWISDVFPEKAEQKKRDKGLDARVAASHKELLDKKDIDLVSVCTPPFAHAETAVDFLNAGKHVMVEKPMAASLEECDAMIAAEKRSGKILAIVAQNRFIDAIYNMKKVLDSGIIGRAVHVQVDSHWYRSRSYYDLWWRGTWEKEGGGCTLNHAVHQIDILGWMLGLPVKVSSMLGNVSHDNAEVEDVSISALRYLGTMAQITASLVHHDEGQQVIIQGERGRISAPWQARASKTKPNGFPEEDPEKEKEIDSFYRSLPALPYTGHQGQIDNVLSAVEGKGKVLVTADEGRRTLEIVTAIYKAGTEERTVDLPIKKEDPFYTLQGIMRGVPHFYQKTTSVHELKGAITVGSAKGR
jgi:predicted dehydrogenase